MTKKLLFDNLPAAVERILELLTSGESDYAALPELVRRMTLLEKKIDHLEKTLSPNRSVMDMRMVCRVLKLRPKAVSELAMSGTLLSHTEGRNTLFYEADVVKCYMTMPAWKAAISHPDSAEPAPEEISAEGRQRIDMKAASVMLDRSPAAIYQLTASNSIPFHKDGKKVYFYTDELRDWATTHPPRKRKPKTL